MLSQKEEKSEISDFPEANSESVYPITVANDWFARGGARYAYKGVVNCDDDDYQFGDKVVVKKFTDKHAMIVTDWEAQENIEKIALELADAWNKTEYVSKIFEVVQSISGQYMGGRGESLMKVDEFVRVEPWLGDKFEKWNSNNGWSLRSSWASSIQAFCHWTYHYTDRELLFCDAQGIKEFRRYRITDPCIVSDKMYGYGDTDGGLACQQAWFGRHRCNDFCKEEWMKPTETEMRIGMNSMDVNRGTTYNWNKADHTTHVNRHKYRNRPFQNIPIQRLPTMPPPNRPPPMFPKRANLVKDFPNTTRFNNPDGI